MSPSSPDKLHERVAVARKARGLSQSELATRAGLPQSVISKIERGVVSDPAFSTMVAVSQALSIPIDAFTSTSSDRFWDELLAERADESSESKSKIRFISIRSSSEPQESVVDGVSDEVVLKLVDAVLSRAIALDASDIHLTPQQDGYRLSMRIDGELREVSRLSTSVGSGLCEFWMRQAYIFRLPGDGRFDIDVNGRTINCRASALATAYHLPTVVLRLLDPAKQQMTLEDLGMSKENLDRFTAAIDHPWGVSLVCGPTGSGKTTTLHAILRELHKPDTNVIAIEDPIVAKLPGIEATELSDSQVSPSELLRSALRSDPDIVIVGEIRERSTMDGVALAAQTGHNVLSSFCSNRSSIGALLQALEIGLPRHVAAEVLNLIAVQRLARVACEHCCERLQATPELLAEAGFSKKAIRRLQEQIDNGALVMRINSSGCANCGKRGHRGRVAIIEALCISDAMRKALVNSADEQELSEIASEEGLITLEESLLDAVLNRQVSLDDAKRVLRTL